MTDSKVERVARAIAWAHWKRLYRHDVSEDSAELWANIGARDQAAYILAARAAAAALEE